MNTGVAAGHLETSLAGVLSSDRIAAGTDAFAVDGLVPAVVVKPSTQDEAAKVVAVALERGTATVPWGGGTHMALGMPPRRYDVALDLTGLNAVIAYDPADLTVTVEAGMRFSDLQALLGKNGQWLPLDPPSGEKTTIGGVIASNASGPARVVFGTARDFVIGMTVASANGVVKSGGRVVKNVAGYDMAKLHIGALGTLGAILQVSLKVSPLPEASWSSRIELPDAAAALTLLRTAARLGLPATGLMAWNQGDAWFAGLRFSGSPATIIRSERELVALAKPRAIGSLADGEWGRLSGRARPAAPRDVVIKLVATTPGDDGDVSDLGDGSEDFLIYPTAGVRYARFPSPDAALVENLRSTRRNLEAAGGALVIEAAPPDLKREVDVWGATRGDFPLMKAIKEQFDPTGVFSPGRYVGGL